MITFSKLHVHPIKYEISLLFHATINTDLDMETKISRKYQLFGTKLLFNDYLHQSF